jgi:hypothetical protein
MNIQQDCRMYTDAGLKWWSKKVLRYYERTPADAIASRQLFHQPWFKMLVTPDDGAVAKLTHVNPWNLDRHHHHARNGPMINITSDMSTDDSIRY